MHSHTDHARERETPGPTAPRPVEHVRRPPTVGLTPSRVLELQRTIGNRATSLLVQRASGDTTGDTTGDTSGHADTGSPEERLSRSLVGSPGPMARVRGAVGVSLERAALEERLTKGPLFSAAELDLIKRCDPAWLRRVGIGGYAEAERYYRNTAKPVPAASKPEKPEQAKPEQAKPEQAKPEQAKGKEKAKRGEPKQYENWLRQPPGTRLLIATIAWNQHGSAPYGSPEHRTPAFTLGRALRLRDTKGLSDAEVATITHQRDRQIRDTFVNTLVPPVLPGYVPPALSGDDDASAAEEAQTAVRGNNILTKVFLILQNGLKTYRGDQHVDFREGDVARALAHGGRVNIRIPQLADAGDAFAMTDWLGLTHEGKDVDPTEIRGYGTHRVSVGANRPEGAPGRFEERGGKRTGARNGALHWAKTKLDLPVETARVYGVNLAAGGWGTLDYHNDVVRPNGTYGHMFIRFQPPERNRDGALMVGIETTAPGGWSPVGYRHTILSSEATANPESSFHGHKQDKIGQGGMSTNQRYVDLNEVDSGTGGWQGFLRDLEDHWTRLRAQAQDDDQVRALYQDLVGPRSDRFRPPSGGGPQG
ncbi:hypothetical protein ACQPZF_25025 [Actinosynnema sp. CS-041913]|uniref:hypothetical protein n=1 Tax=Actinosynnema sp. CS-041913 TaxID=3239917 RepID=UPI003D929F26